MRRPLSSLLKPPVQSKFHCWIWPYGIRSIRILFIEDEEVCWNTDCCTLYNGVLIVNSLLSAHEDMQKSNKRGLATFFKTIYLFLNKNSAPSNITTWIDLFRVEAHKYDHFYMVNLTMEIDTTLCTKKNAACWLDLVRPVLVLVMHGHTVYTAYLSTAGYILGKKLISSGQSYTEKLRRDKIRHNKTFSFVWKMSQRLYWHGWDQIVVPRIVAFWLDWSSSREFNLIQVSMRQIDLCIVASPLTLTILTSCSSINHTIPSQNFVLRFCVCLLLFYIYCNNRGVRLYCGVS